MKKAWYKPFLDSPTLSLGVFIVGFFLLTALFAPLVAPYGETEIVGELWGNPSAKHWLGTDNLGRDVLSRIIYGARVTISITLIATLLAFFSGSALGFTASVLGGRADAIISRVNDILMSFPVMIFALVMISVMGSSIPLLIAIVAIVHATRVFRIARAIGMEIMVMDYIEVARLRKDNLFKVMWYEILPNAMPPLAAEYGLRFCFAILFISALSFLGLGIQPPYADWGGMVRDNSEAIAYGISIPLYPAACIATLTIGVNLIVDWNLKRSANPRDSR